MEAHVNICVEDIKVYCKPLVSNDSYKRLHKKLLAEAKKFDSKEVSSPSAVLEAFSLFEKYLREKFGERFRKAERSKRYKSSSEYIKGASSAISESAAEGRGGSGSSSSSKQGMQEQSLPQEITSSAKKKVLDRTNKAGLRDGTGTPTSHRRLLPKTEPGAKKKVLYNTNKGGQRDGKATPTSKASENINKQKDEGKNPSRDSTTIESENWKTKFEEKEDEMSGLNKQVKKLAQEFGFEGDTMEEIFTEAARHLQSVKEQKNKDQTNSVKGYQSDILSQCERISKGMKEIETNLESVKKVVFKVSKLKDKDHNLEKTMAKIEELHREEEELNELKKAVFNKNNIKDPAFSKETTMNRIHDLQRNVKELEMSLESVKKAVFKVTKVEDKDLEKTEARIQELLRQEEEMLALREGLFNPKKRRDMKKLTYSMEATMEKIHDLQRKEDECLELKNIVFDEELKGLAFKDKLDESQHSVENARTMIRNLKTLLKKNDTDRNMILQTIVGKEKANPTDDVLERIHSLKRDQNDLQDLLKAVSDTDDPLATTQAIEKVKKLKKSMNDQNNIIQQQKENQKQLEMEISNKKEEIFEMKKSYDNMIRKKEEVEQRLTIELKRAQAEKNNALTRLSEVAGAKLTNENPHITDLSDPNRPIKIGEQYSELYDNAWTDVFEKLTEESKMSEKEAIQMLLQILENSYSSCKEIASSRYKNVLAELTLLRFAVPHEKHPKKKGVSKEEKLSPEEITVMQQFLDSKSQSVDIKILKSVLEKIGLSETDMKYIKNLLKLTVEGTCHFVEQYIWGKRSEIQTQYGGKMEIAKPYLKKCVRICWLMVAQDPPVCLKASDQKDKKFDKDFYREYTNSGKKMDYIVWPALLLHEGGPILKKGVAQPKT